MKLKLINIIGILLTILIVGGILYPWSKNNVERFVDPPISIPEGSSTSPAASSIEDMNELQDKIKTVYQNLLETRLYANDFEDRVNALKDQTDKKVTVDGGDYINLINDIQNELQKKIESSESMGYVINNQLQNNKIIELNNNITLLSDKIKNLGFNITNPISSLENSNIKSIKSIHNGVNLNVKNLSLYNLDKNTYNSISSNISPEHSTIMIFLNNGCLKYTDGKYTVNNCELTNVNQYFVFKKIENGVDFLNHLDGVYLEQQKNINQNNNTTQYPFNIIYPISNMKKCVKIDIDGISIEDCRPLSLNLDQRWISSPITKQNCY
jgi:hypothetical protein